jgi:hypothetical protein
MKKTLLGLLAAVLLTPWPSFASDLTVSYSHDEFPDVAVASDDVLINVGINDEDQVYGRVWLESDNAWSSRETIFTDSIEPFDLEDIRDIVELNNGTIVLANGDDLVSYSTTNGFQHYTVPFLGFDMNTSKNKITFVDTCSDETAAPAVVTWTEADGFSAETTINDSFCTSEVHYYTSTKNTLLDYYYGIAYNRNHAYAVRDSVDLTGLNYVSENDDWDAQGNNPDFVTKKNGDVAFSFETSLYGYAYGDSAWRQVITLPDGFTVIGDDSEYSYLPLQTGDNKQIFAFTANEDATEYQIYRWISTTGWQLEKTYNFDESAELVRANIDKSKSSLDWAFWFEDSNTLNVYQWTDDNGYSKRTDRTIACTGTCQIIMDVSKKDKVFIAAVSNTDSDNKTAVLAWKPASDTWESDTLPASSSNYITTHVTNSGRWIVVRQEEDNSYSVKRWTPDNGWGSHIELGAEATYYNGDQLYYVDLASNEDLTVNFYKWKTHEDQTVGTVSDVETFHDDDTCIYDDYLFIYYSGPQDEVSDEIAL